MNQENFLKKLNEKPSKEMVKFYEERTKNHIERVRSNINFFMLDKDFDLKELYKRLKDHDKSKFSVAEYVPYIWMTEFYRKKQLGEEFKYPSESIKKEVDEAIKHHYEVNRHHPEFHNNIEDMTDEDIVEMVCDWVSMSQEFNNSLKEFANKKIDKQYKFSDNQKNLIYKLIEEFESCY